MLLKQRKCYSNYNTICMYQFYIRKEFNQMDKMFCFQCEQTAGCTGCTGAMGVCGKSADTSKLQDKLTGAIIGLAKSTSHNPKRKETDKIIIEGLLQL